MDLRIEGRRAVVAGSSAGLGLEAARALLAEGVHVALNGRDAERLGRAAEDLRAGSEAGRVVEIGADVSSPEGAGELVERAADALGGVDILVANAGGPPPGTFATTDLDAYRSALELNLLSTVAMCRAAVPSMQERRWGRVVAITSIGARQPIPNLMASSVARAGVSGFLKNLATEVAADGVTVNSLQPGVHSTERLESLAPGAVDSLRSDVPAGVLGDPRDFGVVAAFLCSEHAAFLTGAAIPVDGGASRALM